MRKKLSTQRAGVGFIFLVLAFLILSANEVPPSALTRAEVATLFIFFGMASIVILRLDEKTVQLIRWWRHRKLLKVFPFLDWPRIKKEVEKFNSQRT